MTRVTLVIESFLIAVFDERELQALCIKGRDSRNPG